MAALIGGADDEHPHVLATGRIEGGTVVLTDVVPVKVDVIERPAVAGGCDQINGAMEKPT